MVESQSTAVTTDFGRFEHGTIQFEIKDEKEGITAGETLSGAILVIMSQPFEAKSLHLSLYGCEESSFTLTNEQGI
jgi:hypothetical protein